HVGKGCQEPPPGETDRRHKTDRPGRRVMDALDVVVEGRGTYALNPTLGPPTVVLVLDAAAADGSAVARFSVSRCDFAAGATRLGCGSLPPIVPCRKPAADALVVCDAGNAAAAQEAYYAVNATFFSGACSALPGFTPSPFVVCIATGTAVNFVVDTA